MVDASIPDTLRRINGAVVRADSRAELERSVCEVAAESTPYITARIASVDDASGRIVPRAASGAEADEGETTDGASPSEGLVRRAAHTRSVQVERDRLSVAAVPLVHESAVYGALTVSTDRRDAFDERERRLLAAVGETVGYALQDLDVRARQSRVYRNLFEYAPVMYILTREEDGVAVVDDCNRCVLEKLGYEKDEVVDRPLADFYTEESARKLREYTYDRDPERLPRDFVTADGEVVHTRMWVVPRVDAAGNDDGAYALYTDVTKQRQAEAVLRNARALDASIDGVAIFNPDFECVYANEAFVSLFDYESSRAVEGASWDAFVVTEERDRIQREVSSALDGEGTWRGNTTCARATGATFPTEISVTNAEDVGTICIVRDVSDRVERERTLDRERKRYQTLTETAPDAILVADPETRTIVEANSQAESLTGYSRSELVGMPQSQLHPDADRYRQLFDFHVGASEEMGPTIVTEFHDGSNLEVVRKDGARRAVEINANLIEVEDERLFLGVFRDVSEREYRENRLRLLERQYETVFENTQDALFLVDVDRNGEFRIERFNEVEESLTGLTTEEVRGKRLHEVLDSETAAEVEARYRECVERRETLTYEEELSLPDGTRIWQTKLSPVVVDGRVRQLVGAARDITDLREDGMQAGD
jgi:PAS domain S-box-containing protein